MRQETRAVLLLTFLSPFLAEVLGGSTHPLQLVVQPLSFPLLWLFYGSGVLLIREAWIRLGRGKVGLMLLGALYGVVEEGLVIRSWFDPNWPDLGALKDYGRVFGVNTSWAVLLTAYHATMSIALPILIVELLYPELRGKSLIGKRGTLLAIIAFCTSAFAFAHLTGYFPSLGQYSVAILSALALFLLARKFGGRDVPFTPSRPFTAGFISGATIFTALAFLPKVLPPLATDAVGTLALVLFFASLNGDERRTVLGFLAFWLIVYDVLLELIGVLGEAILGPLSYALLFRRLGTADRARTGQPRAEP
ncbi:conserved membrane protein of unknown function [Thermococcus nautili]|uniref:hypothetical protein n=1 Tax=Thermococcus nautili TaxID=195522 RepID=UPI002553F749|nr:hypothetical protein [Thermococcus nautili]CAI1491912.1 conserved membrane protein of unknown function [Thermococcus nautili]